MTYSVFDDPKLFQAVDTRNWNPKTGNGWRRNKAGYWQYYSDWQPVKGKVDKSGVKDVFNLGEHGWNILPTKKVAPIPAKSQKVTSSSQKGDRSVSQALARSNQIKAYSEDTGRSVEDVQNIVSKEGLETVFGTDGKVTSKGVATNNANASKAKLLDIPVEPGRTRWVGTNSTWTDRYGNTIAPMEGTATTTTVKNTPTELLKQETKNSGLDPTKLISEDGSKKGPWMTLKDGSINPEWQKAYPKSTEAKIDLIDQGLKTDQQGNLVPWYEGTAPGTRLSFNDSPLQKWQEQQHQQLQQQQTQSNKVTAKQRMEGASKAAASAAVNLMIAKLTEPKKGEEGANRSEGAITGGGNPWEEFYAPSFYSV